MQTHTKINKSMSGHPAGPWAARIAHRNVKKIGELILQRVRYFSWSQPKANTTIFFRHVCPQFGVTCQSVPIIRLSISGVQLKF